MALLIIIIDVNSWISQSISWQITKYINAGGDDDPYEEPEGDYLELEWGEEVKDGGRGGGGGEESLFFSSSINKILFLPTSSTTSQVLLGGAFEALITSCWGDLNMIWWRGEEGRGEGERY